jgi:ubiquinone/menaquinone biosynthesis C-methylase UbiE
MLPDFHLHAFLKIYKMEKLYPDSGVELTPTIAKHYDSIMNFVSMGAYRSFINRAIKDMNIRPDDSILDMGCGTGRNALLMADYLTNGNITGLDISPLMEKQFIEKTKRESRLKFINKRIDLPFNLDKPFDTVFISFVIHGLPQEIRETVIRNAYSNLKPGGTFFILDYSEFDMDKMPWLHRQIFKKVECKYAFDFIKRDFKDILKLNGFGSFSEHFYVRNYVRLLKAGKDS